MAFKNTFVLICAAFAASASAEATEERLVSFEEFAGLSGDTDLSPEEVAEIKKESKPRFDKLDEDKSGKLSQSELDKEEEEPEKSEELALGEEADEDDAGDEDTEDAGEFSEDGEGFHAVEELAEDDEAADEDDEDENVFMGLDDEQVSAMEANRTETAQKMANQLLQDLDKNKDNKLSFEEFAGVDDHKQSDHADADNVEDEETKKVREEAKQVMQSDFKASDKNNDGFLNMEELEALHSSTGEITQEAEDSKFQGL